MKKRCMSCFRVMSTPARFTIFEHLKRAGKRLTVTTLVKLTSLRQPTVTFHIDKLAKTGLLVKTKIGREVYCQTQQKCPRCPLFV